MLKRVAMLSGLSLLVMAAGFAITEQFIATPTSTEPLATPPFPRAATAPVAVAQPASPQPTAQPVAPKIGAMPSAVTPPPLVNTPASPFSHTVSAPPEKVSTPVVTAPPVENAAPAVETPTPPPKPSITVEKAEKEVPTWLRTHFGEGDGQIAQVVLQRARALYLQKVTEAADIEAVARAVEAGRSLSRARPYWNTSCLKEIGSPKFWSKETLEPILAQYMNDHPAPSQRATPICKAQ